MLTETMISLFEQMDIKSINAHLKRDTYRSLQKDIFIKQYR